MRLAWFGPLAPVRSGIAHYASLLIPELSREHEVVLFSDQVERDDTSPSFHPSSELHAGEFDAVFVQIGNNPYHESQYRWATRNRGVLVIHDLVLHHLLVELTLARGDTEGYAADLTRDHGLEGAAWARARAAGVGGEIGNFLFPAFRSIAAGAKHIIVHNRWAAEQVRGSGVNVPVTVAPHPWVPGSRSGGASSDVPDARWSIPDGARVVSLLGFVTAAKRVAETMRAFTEVAERDREVHLLIAGSPAPNIDLESLARKAGLPPERWTSTGYLSDEDFDAAVAISERVVNLRYPTAGETSGPLMRVIGAGTHVAVSDYAQFRELPSGTVVRVPLGEGEHQALVEFIEGTVGCNQEMQRRWARTELDPARSVDAYLRAARGEGDQVDSFHSGECSIPLFVDWRWSARRFDEQVDVTLHLESAAPVRSATWGAPGYRLLVDVQRRDGTVQSRSIMLPGDVHQGQTTTVTIGVPGDWTELRLRHGLQGVPAIAEEPFAKVTNDAIR